MVHVECTVSVAGMWAVVDDGRVLAVRTTREGAITECGRLRGVACHECGAECAYNEMVEMGQAGPAATHTERF